MRDAENVHVFNRGQTARTPYGLFNGGIMVARQQNHGYFDGAHHIGHALHKRDRNVVAVERIAAEQHDIRLHLARGLQHDSQRLRAIAIVLAGGIFMIHMNVRRMNHNDVAVGGEWIFQFKRFPSQAAAIRRARRARTRPAPPLERSLD